MSHAYRAQRMTASLLEGMHAYVAAAHVYADMGWVGLVELMRWKSLTHQMEEVALDPRREREVYGNNPHRFPYRGKSARMEGAVFTDSRTGQKAKIKQTRKRSK